jgi:hypothetical protein
MLLLALLLAADAGSISPEAPSQIEVQAPLIERLCPPVVARWNGEEMKRAEFLRLARSDDGIIAAGKNARALAQAATQLIDSIYQKRAGLVCASREGLIPDLAKGKAEYLRQEAQAAPGEFATQLSLLGLSREQAIRQGADTACVMEWQALLVSRQLPGEIESRLYYQQHLKKFDSAGAIRLGKIAFPFQDEASAVLAGAACSAAENALRQGEISFDQACKKFGAPDKNVADCQCFVPIEKTRPELAPAFKLPAGQVLRLQIPGAWILLRIHDKRPAGPLPFDEVDHEIRQGLAAAAGAREAREKCLKLLKEGEYRNFLRQPQN